MKKLIAFFLAFVVCLGFLATPQVLSCRWILQFSSGNCAACHTGGRNAVNPQKTLSKEDLTKWDMFDLEKIKAQVTNGKAAMPKFGGKLSEEEIDAVANYVLSQAEAGW
ncbi:MAG: c-type cytochrome [Synechococcaceae cyanobacterium RL_1_2]|nr:c-type cytochrome [Synechococcaceae cyanobacterium RL_1_2]